jgi:hypothetical protein
LGIAAIRSLDTGLSVSSTRDENEVRKGKSIEEESDTDGSESPPVSSDEDGEEQNGSEDFQIASPKLLSEKSNTVNGVVFRNIQPVVPRIRPNLPIGRHCNQLEDGKVKGVSIQEAIGLGEFRSTYLQLRVSSLHLQRAR